MKTWLLPDNIRLALVQYLANSIPQITGAQYIELWNALQGLQEVDDGQDRA